MLATECKVSRRIQNDIEAGVVKKNVIPFAVVGMVDIVSSCALSNSLGVTQEWDLKAKFFHIAQMYADETGMMILNTTGDGFLFWANYYKRLLLAIGLKTS